MGQILLNLKRNKLKKSLLEKSAAVLRQMLHWLVVSDELKHIKECCDSSA